MIIALAAVAAWLFGIPALVIALIAVPWGAIPARLRAWARPRRDTSPPGGIRQDAEPLTMPERAAWDAITAFWHLDAAEPEQREDW